MNKLNVEILLREGLDRDVMISAIRKALAALGDLEEVRITYEGRRAPVQANSGYTPAGTISWEVHEQAWANYAACGHGSQSAERMAERGGFSYCELQCALAGHYNRTNSEHVHPPVPTFQPRVKQ